MQISSSRDGRIDSFENNGLNTNYLTIEGVSIHQALKVCTFVNSGEFLNF